MLSKNQKTIALSGAIALTAVLAGGAALGFANSAAPAQAGAELPASFQVEDIGDGGLVPDSIRLVGDTDDYQVWTATDRSGNLCTVAYATPEGNGSAACGSSDALGKRGIPSSMQVGTAEADAISVKRLQTYLIPDSVDAGAAAKIVDGAVAHGQVLVRYGQIEQRGNASVEVPMRDGGTMMLELIGDD